MKNRNARLDNRYTIEVIGSQKRKKVCSFYLKPGGCNKGDGCKFSHESPGVKPSNCTSMSASSSMYSSAQVPREPQMTLDEYRAKTETQLSKIHDRSNALILYDAARATDQWKAFMFHKPKYGTPSKLNQAQAAKFVLCCYVGMDKEPKDVLLVLGDTCSMSLAVTNISQILSAEYSENYQPPNSKTLSFLYCLVPLCALMSDAKVVSSALHQFSSNLLGLALKKVDHFLPKYLECLQKLIDRRQLGKWSF